MRNHPVISIVLAGLVWVLPQLALGQDWEGEGWEARVAKTEAKPGGRAAVDIEMTVKGGHYVYLWMERNGKRSQRISFEVEPSSGTAKIDKVNFPKGKEKFEKLLDQEVSIYETGNVTIPIEVLFTDFTPGTIASKIGIRAQSCTKGNPEGNFCKIPRTVELTSSVKLALVATPAPTPIRTVRPTATPTQVVVASPVPSAQPTASIEPTPEPTATPIPVVGDDDDDDEAGLWALLQSDQGLQLVMQRGLFWVLIFVFLGGLLVNLTPCVYPLIPITVSVVGAKAATSRGRAFMLSVFYVLGMGAVNTLLGWVAGVTGTRVGFIFTYPPVVLAVAGIIFVLALGMFGIINLQVPASVQTRLNTVGGNGPGGVFLMGLVAGVIASPCSTPVLGAIIAVIVAGQIGAAKGLLLMALFSAGMGLPFIVLGTFSGLLTSMPRSGAWMNVIKNGMGLMLLAGGYYFLGMVLPEWAFQVSLGVGLVIVGVFLGAGKAIAADSEAKAPRLWKAAGILAVAAGVFFFLGGLGQKGYGPAFLHDSPITRVTQKPAANDIGWRHGELAAVQEAEASGKPMFIDFFTDECKPCKQLDNETFSNPKVAALLDGNFIPTKLDLTERSWTTKKERQEIDRLVKKYSVQGGVPRLMFVAPDGTIIQGLTRTGFENAEKFHRRLEKALVCKDAPKVCRI